MYVKGNFTQEEMELAKRVAFDRESLSRSMHLKHSAGATLTLEEAKNMELIGCLGELAVAKYLEIPWNQSNGTFLSEPDVYKYDARASNNHNNNLIIRNRDSNDKISILVTIEGTEYRIHGWMRNLESKQSKYLRAPNNRPAAYFVPRSSLHEMNTLPNE